MRYYFRRVSGVEWYQLIRDLRRRELEFKEVKSEDLYDKDKVNDVFTVYYFRTSSKCKIIYYDFDTRWHKRLREISFSPKEIDPVKCVLTFRKIAESFNEIIPYEPHHRYTNGIYTYYKGGFKGYITALDMNSAYLYALSQPLADWTTKTEIKPIEVFKQEYDYYLFENELHSEIFYKEDMTRIGAALLWADIKVYGFKSRLYFQETVKELYRLKCEVHKEKYKNVANIAVGCMHKRSGKQNNTTIAASLYAWFAWYIDSLVAKFEKKGYNVVMITTDSIKIKGKYNPSDNLVTIGKGLGEFKIEYEGDAKYFSSGHYEEKDIKWKGKPQYMRDGLPPCKFIDNIENERGIYEAYAITK